MIEYKATGVTKIKQMADEMSKVGLNSSMVVNVDMSTCLNNVKTAFHLVTSLRFSTRKSIDKQSIIVTRVR